MCRIDFEAEDYAPRPLRPKTAPGDLEARAKAFESLSRPTTASRAKRLGDCTLCADKEEMDKKNSLEPFEYEYGEEKTIPAEELEEVRPKFFCLYLFL